MFFFEGREPSSVPFSGGGGGISVPFLGGGGISPEVPFYEGIVPFMGGGGIVPFCGGGGMSPWRNLPLPETVKASIPTNTIVLRILIELC